MSLTPCRLRSRTPYGQATARTLSIPLPRQSNRCKNATILKCGSAPQRGSGDHRIRPDPLPALL